MKPEDIEKLSFKIIDEEAGEHSFSFQEWQIVRRVIHTTADFEYIKNVRFHEKAIASGLKAIRHGKAIVTDTNMAKAGIRKKELSHFGVAVESFINTPFVHQRAINESMTRAKAAVDAGVEKMKGGIYVIGNAPTALMHLIDLIKSKKASPALVIGLPVGFVNAKESKDALMELDHPYISNIGRKGGSNVAAAVVNALAIMAVSNDMSVSDKV